MRRLASRVSACLASLLFVATAWGAPVVVVGFETGDTSTNTPSGGNLDAEVGGCTGTYSMSTTTVRTGTYAFRVNPTTTAVGSCTVYPHIAAGTSSASTSSLLSGRFYFRYATKPSSGSEEFLYSAAVTGLVLRIDSAGNLMAFGSGSRTTQIGSTGTATLSANTWYRIEWTSNGTNAWAVYVDGTLDMSGTDDIVAQTSYVFGKAVNRNSNSVDFFYDDILITDGSSAPGAGQVVRLAPTGNGTYTAWTDGDGDATGNYTDVDDAPGDPAYDSLTSYSLSTTNTDAETVDVTDSSTAGISGTINAVKSITVHRRNDASAVNIQHRIRSNGTDYDLTNASTLDATWYMLASVRGVDPFDSAAWTTGDIDGLQVGVEHNTATSRTLNFTMACVMVDFEPSTSIQPPRTMHQQRMRRQ